jgi:hypothetical protein
VAAGSDYCGRLFHLPEGSLLDVQKMSCMTRNEPFEIC